MSYQNISSINITSDSKYAGTNNIYNTQLDTTGKINEKFAQNKYNYVVPTIYQTLPTENPPEIIFYYNNDEPHINKQNISNYDGYSLMELVNNTYVDKNVPFGTFVYVQDVGELYIYSFYVNNKQIWGKIEEFKPYNYVHLTKTPNSLETNGNIISRGDIIVRNSSFITTASIASSTGNITTSGNLTVSGSASLSSGTISTTPSNVNDIVNKGWVDKSKGNYHVSTISTSTPSTGNIGDIILLKGNDNLTLKIYDGVNWNDYDVAIGSICIVEDDMDIYIRLTDINNHQVWQYTEINISEVENITHFYPQLIENNDSATNSEYELYKPTCSISNSKFIIKPNNSYNINVNKYYKYIPTGNTTLTLYEYVLINYDFSDLSGLVENNLYKPIKDISNDNFIIYPGDSTTLHDYWIYLYIGKQDINNITKYYFKKCNIHKYDFSFNFVKDKKYISYNNIPNDPLDPTDLPPAFITNTQININKIYLCTNATITQGNNMSFSFMEIEPINKQIVHCLLNKQQLIYYKYNNVDQRWTTLGIGKVDENNSTGEIFNSYIGYDKNIASGDYSHAEGKDTSASGDYSHVEGNGTIALGECSHAEGNGTIALGECSHAEGVSTKAIGDYSHAEGTESIALGHHSHVEGYKCKVTSLISHAEGYNNIVSGNYSHAEGHEVKAYGDYSHAEGYQSEVSGQYSHVEGFCTVVSGGKSHAEGQETVATRICSHAEGYKTKAHGDYSHAEGNTTEASGDNSHAEGNTTEATGNNSHAEGNTTKATGNNSHAEGYTTKATGNNSHAEGYITEASGEYSHAEGYNTTASAYYSHAEGATSVASGYYSHAGGYYTIANTSSMTAIGRFNKYDSTQTISTIDRLFVIGNGTADNSRTDAFVVQNNGNCTINGNLYLGNQQNYIYFPVTDNTVNHYIRSSGNYFQMVTNKIIEISNNNSFNNATIGIKLDSTNNNNINIKGYIDSDIDITNRKYIQLSREKGSNQYFRIYQYNNTAGPFLINAPKNSIEMICGAQNFTDPPAGIRLTLDSSLSTGYIQLKSKDYIELITPSCNITSNTTITGNLNINYTSGGNHTFYLNCLKSDNTTKQLKIDCYKSTSKYFVLCANDIIDLFYTTNISSDTITSNSNKGFRFKSSYIEQYGTVVPINNANNVSNQTITHNMPIFDDISNYQLGMPVFIANENKSYYLQEIEGDNCYDYVEITNDLQNHAIDCIPKIQLTDNGKFIGVITGIYNTNEPYIEKAVNAYAELYINCPTAQVSTHGDYIFKVNDNTAEHQTTSGSMKHYEVGDNILYDGTIIDPNTPLTYNLTHNCVGIITCIPSNNTNYVSVFKC